MTAGPEPVQVAVAGCGGAAFGIHLPTLAALPHVKICAVADRDAGRAREAAARFGGRVASTPGDLCAGADLLAVLTGVHEPWIRHGLAAGVHVFCEKPVDLDYERARQLRREAEDAGVLLEVGTVRAFDPAVTALLQQIPDKELRGGWLVKADGTDAQARRLFLPGGPDYTFGQDPPQTPPSALKPSGRKTLRVLLWEGYHLLTVLALAAPRAQPVACTVTDGRVTGCVRTRHGATISLSIGPGPTDTYLDQAILTGAHRTYAAEFASPYGPGGPGLLFSTHADGGIVPVQQSAPAVQMWQAICARVLRHRDGKPTVSGTAELAEKIEWLAYGLAYLATETL